VNRKLVLVGQKGGGGSGVVEQRATFLLGKGGAQPIAANAAGNYLPVRTAGTCFETSGVSAAPGSDVFRVVLLASSDEGATWRSVFDADDYFELTDGTQQVKTVFDATDAALVLGDRLRIDVIAGSSEDWQEITIVLRWS